MNKRSRQRNKERNKYAGLKNIVTNSAKGLDPLEIPNCGDSKVKDWFHFHPNDIEKLSKYKRQRIERGFDDTELWNLDFTLAKFALPRLVEFRKFVNGYPPEFEKFEDWTAIIDKMIFAFDHIVNEADYSDERDKKFGVDWINYTEMKKLPNGDYELVHGKGYDEERMKRYREDEQEERAKIQEGLDLFGKYFQNLWW